MKRSQFIEYAKKGMWMFRFLICLSFRIAGPHAISNISSKKTFELLIRSTYQSGKKTLGISSMPSLQQVLLASFNRSIEFNISWTPPLPCDTLVTMKMYNLGPNKTIPPKNPQLFVAYIYQNNQWSSQPKNGVNFASKRPLLPAIFAALVHLVDFSWGWAEITLFN